MFTMLGPLVLIAVSLAAALWGFDALSGTLGFSASFQVSKNQAGFVAPFVSNNPKVNKAVKYVVGAGIAGGANEIYTALLTVTKASSTTLDLTALVDALLAPVNFARVKGLVIWLLAASDTAPDGTTAGNASSDIVVGNATTNSFQSPYSEQAAGTVKIQNGGFGVWCRPDATGWIVDGTHKSMKIAASDAVIDAKVCIVIVGADA